MKNLDESGHNHISKLPEDQNTIMAATIKRVIGEQHDLPESCTLGIVHAVRDTPEVAALTAQAALEVGYALGRIIAEQEAEMRAFQALSSLVDTLS